MTIRFLRDFNSLNQIACDPSRGRGTTPPPAQVPPRSGTPSRPISVTSSVSKIRDLSVHFA
jgi:hypothetical protein